ncbi:hypothetical protein AAG906_023444 [Vitis piasezkii]
MTDTWEGMDLIEQAMEKGIEDLRKQIQDKICSLRSNKGVLGSQVPTVSHEDFVSFKDKVMSMLTNMESSMKGLVTHMETLVSHMETRDQEVRQKLVIYKTAMSTWVMATHEALKVEVPKPHVFKHETSQPHTYSICEYVKEFSTLILEILNMTKEGLLFNFMDNLQHRVEQELRRRVIQDLATTMVAESLAEYKKERLFQAQVAIQG